MADSMPDDINNGIINGVYTNTLYPYYINNSRIFEQVSVDFWGAPAGHPNRDEHEQGELEEDKHR